MNVRALRQSDIPVLRTMAEKNGFPYPDFGGAKLEAVRVLVDDDDQPMMAAAAERRVQLYLWCGDFERPLAKVHALRILHEEMAEALKKKGYHEADAFLPPAIADRLGRRLMKTFGWVKNWPSWARRF